MKTELIFGIHAVESFIEHHSKRVLQLWLQSNEKNPRLQKLKSIAKSKQVDCLLVTKDKLQQLVGEVAHQGVVAKINPASELPETALFDLLDQLTHPAFLLLIDGVQDPHNLGACLRTADAAGVDAVIIPKNKAVGLNATVRKVACGAAESVPVISVTNLARVMEQLKQRGIWLAGTAGEAEQLVNDVDYTGDIGIVVGAEGTGLRQLTRKHCDYLVKLPMYGIVSSLNVSVATGVCLYEVVRQRRKM